MTIALYLTIGMVINLIAWTAAYYLKDSTMTDDIKPVIAFYRNTFDESVVVGLIVMIIAVCVACILWPFVLIAGVVSGLLGK